MLKISDFEIMLFKEVSQILSVFDSQSDNQDSFIFTDSVLDFIHQIIDGVIGVVSDFDNRI